jgi:excinuclease ABC subunit C
MVVFIAGHPEISAYRHFKVEGTEDRSDPHAMKQILSRRFRHPEWGRPDLIVLDGGIPQLSIVSPVIPEDIPVIALAKKRETLYFYNEDKKITELSLPLEDPVLNLFRSLRDEAHRFATTFHIQQREKSLLS